MAVAHGTHDFEDDPRNARILIWVNGELVPRQRAVVSVFDAGFDARMARHHLSPASLRIAHEDRGRLYAGTVPGDLPATYRRPTGRRSAPRCARGTWPAFARSWPVRSWSACWPR